MILVLLFIDKLYDRLFTVYVSYEFIITIFDDIDDTFIKLNLTLEKRWKVQEHLIVCVVCICLS